MPGAFLKERAQGLSFSRPVLIGPRVSSTLLDWI